MWGLAATSFAHQQNARSNRVFPISSLLLCSLNIFLLFSSCPLALESMQRNELLTLDVSHQPSTVDNLKSTANSAYETVANTVAPAEQDEYDPDKDKTNFKKDAHGNTVKKGDLKDKLNEAALDGPPEREESCIEKVVSKIQQQAFEQGDAEEVAKHEGPPNRPDHDVQVEQFLRKQYHSKSGDGMPNPDSKD